jgi:hypothetical protein
MFFRFVREADIVKHVPVAPAVEKENASALIAYFIELTTHAQLLYQAAMMHMASDRSDISRLSSNDSLLFSIETDTSIISQLTISLQIVYNVFVFVFFALSPIWKGNALLHLHPMRLAGRLKVVYPDSSGSNHKGPDFYNSRMTLCFRSTIDDPTW